MPLANIPCSDIRSRPKTSAVLGLAVRPFGAGLRRGATRCPRPPAPPPAHVLRSRPERANRGCDARQPAVLLRELLDACAPELLTKIELRSVNDHEIRFQRQDPLDVRIEQAADPWQRLHLR